MKANALNYLLHKKQKLKESIRDYFKIPTIQLTLGILIGIVLAMQESATYTILSLVLIIFIFKKKSLFTLASIMIGMIVFITFNQSIKSEIKNTIGKNDPRIVQVIEEPVTNDFNQTFIAKDSTLNGLMTITTFKYPTFSTGDKLNIKGEINVPKASKNFDRIAYLKNKKVFYEIENPEIIKVWDSTLTDLIYDIRERISKIITNKLHEPGAALLNGIIIGDDSKLDEDFKDTFVQAGLSHITSVSGYNFWLIYNFIIYFSGRVKRNLLYLFTIIFILIFISIVGFTNLPALRATFMILFIIGAKLTGRKHSTISGIILSTLLITLEYPYYLNNISFQLSISATIGLFLISKPFVNFFTNLRINKLISEIIGTTLATTLSTFPVILVNFPNMSLLGLLSNLLVLPVVPFITVTTIAGVFLDILGVQFFPFTIFYIVQTTLDYIIFTVDTIGHLSWGIIENKALGFAFFLSLLAFLLLADFFTTSKKNYHA